jgi:hypothetical protein
MVHLKIHSIITPRKVLTIVKYVAHQTLNDWSVESGGQIREIQSKTDGNEWH